MALVKDIAKLRNEKQQNKLKLVIMSATLDLEKFTQYFESKAVVTGKFLVGIVSCLHRVTMYLTLSSYLSLS